MNDTPNTTLGAGGTSAWPGPLDPYLHQMQQLQNIYASKRADLLAASTPIMRFPAPRPFGLRLAFAFLSPYFLLSAGLLHALARVAVFGDWVMGVYTRACKRVDGPSPGDRL